MPLPQVSFDLQSLEQPSPAVVLPSSQTSPSALSTTPSPQRGSTHDGRHGALGLFEFAAPASQTSPRAVSTMPSPHFGSWQLVRHAALGFCELPAPASHCSPFAVSTMPLPQVSFDLQSAEQPSPEVWFPSSQPSPFVLSVIVSPQRWGRQFVRQLAFGAFEFDTPRSQTSPSETLSTIESPHFGSWQFVRHAAFGLFEFAAPASHCSPFATSTM